MNETEYNKLYSKKEYNVSSVYDHIIRIRIRYLNDVSGRLLDHGFGNGVLSKYFQEEGFDVYGIDSSTAALDTISTIPNLKPEQFKIIGCQDSKVPFEDNFFNVVVSNQVLYFLQGRELIDATLRDVYRVLAPKGKIAYTVMSEDNYFFTEKAENPVEQGMVNVKITGRITRDWNLYRFKDADDVKSAFEQAGFVIDDFGYFDFKLLDTSKGKHYIVLAHKP